MQRFKEFLQVELKEGVQDEISLSVPLLIRLLEFAREDAKDDLILHKMVENIQSLHRRGVSIIGMDNYKDVIKK